MSNFTRNFFFENLLLSIVRPIGISSVAADFGIAFECQPLEYNKVVKWMLQITVPFSIAPSAVLFGLQIKSE